MIEKGCNVQVGFVVRGLDSKAESHEVVFRLADDVNGTVSGNPFVGDDGYGVEVSVSCSRFNSDGKCYGSNCIKEKLKVLGLEIKAEIKNTDSCIE